MTGIPSSDRRSESASRIVGLDALRAACMLLGITLHASVAYMPTRMPNLVWPVHNAQTTPLCDLMFWGVHGFRLPIWFVLSGFFAEMLLCKRGEQDFIRQRVRRLVLPYFAALFIINSLTLAIFAWGWEMTGRCTIWQLLDPLNFEVPEIQNNFFGPAHLWFLADLIPLTVAYWFVRREFIPAADSGQRKLFGLDPEKWSGWLPVLIAIPASMFFWGNVKPLVEFENTFIPVLPRIAFYTMFFLAGTLFYRYEGWFLSATQSPWRHLMLVPPLAMLLLVAIQYEIANPCLANKLLVAVTYSLVAWLSVFGWFGTFMHYWRVQAPWVRYLSDASYWMFLIHLPLVTVTQVALHRLDWPPELKFLTVTLVTVAVGLAMYAGFVRYTVIGDVLHGPRSRPVRTPGPALPAGAGVSPRPATTRFHGSRR